MTKNYHVLARKYRPSNFADLVGQDALVRTLSNAVKMDRLAHAFLLTGIRGIGKTTTARIIAKLINCSNLDKTQEIVQDCGICNNCRAYASESHPDIIEIDAASKTGVNDIREIIENCNYLPQLGKYKLFIIDEVHMLSNNAFNALLKTLEEPPPHVKFIFATTEIKKIPITILSRCQKFDLKRLNQDLLISHLSNIANKEDISIEPDCLKLIAKCAQGSVRDALSLLDQAIAMSYDLDKVTTKTVIEMIGASDQEHFFIMLDHIFAGRIKEALMLLSSLYDMGADPVATIEGLFDLVHLINKIKIVNDETSDYNLADYYLVKAKELASKCDVVYLTTIWQLLFKGLQEIKSSNNSLNVAEMILIRIGYTACLPSPIELANINIETDIVKKKLHRDVISTEETKDICQSFEDVINLFKEKRELLLHHYLVEEVSLVKFEPGRITLCLSSDAPKDLASNIGNFLNKHTEKKWDIIVSKDQGNQTIRQQIQHKEELAKQQAKSNEIVNLVLDKFPGSTIISVKDNNIT